MNVYIAVVVIACVAPIVTQDNCIESFQDILNSTIIEFLKKPKNATNEILIEEKTMFQKVMEPVSNSVKWGFDIVSGAVQEQQKKISDYINNYMEFLKETNRKLIESWLYGQSEADQLKIPDTVLSVPAIISRHGYTCETHTVISQGYLLNIHRIPRSRNGGNIPRKTVILQHGLFASSADWILNGPGKALAYVLADAGYDVWMSNIRGNKYSREHIWLKTDSESYWNFSWHDVALHDIPRVIDYILEIKGSDTKITYIGHSMGTTILFAMLTLKPEYNTILSAGFALAPVVYTSNLKSGLRIFAPVTSFFAYLDETLFGAHEFMPKQSLFGKFSSLCNVVDSAVCKNIIFCICGDDEEQFNKTILPVFLAHLGTGTSWKTLVHFAQEVLSGGEFQQFDYNTNGNMKVYGSNTPPVYNLSQITLPITLFWAQNDWLSSEEDVKKLQKNLPSTTEVYKIPHAKFNHLDYLWAIDVADLLNEQLLHSLERVYNSEKHFFFNIEFGK